ncbi:coenzyme F420 hydrogenase [Microbulbifer flavimaris]|uniref:Coenzyme F420 hydrogenase n=1 Tax=Microbulbifer flavimaris TaxID=1781068 RepID=A0ABX4HYP4_9GAMM|nr:MULTISPECIES: Coenzyme F420 hydrogenase/dehydrogenase, beta subunit C-terminal domain [Microbulbifer]PCO05186.1 coenzyme F420 hydrogenase [Microbulbifer flavimaris]
MQKIKTIEDVRRSHLCTGCGACASLEPQRFTMVDVADEGRRPALKKDAAPETGLGMAACPGIGLQHDYDVSDTELLSELGPAWGPVYRVIEGHAGDPAIRFAGSSGGAATALALFCLEQRGMRGVLHTAADPEQPYLNRTVFSRDRSGLLGATGSRYAPSSPCEGLDQVAAADGPCVFIGKPCDAAALQRAQQQSSALRENTGLAIAFFCAGVPNTSATLELAKHQGAKSPDHIKSLRYRGNGWPGNWTLDYRDEEDKAQSSRMSYAESWDFLQKHRQWRCYVCADHTGEFADIAVGDPWHRTIGPGEMGSSLIVARTRRGLELLQAALDAGYLEMVSDDPSLLPRSQPNLIAARGNLWARLSVMRLFGACTPHYSGFALLPFWLRELSLVDKMHSLLSTVRRIFRKRLLRPVAVAQHPQPAQQEIPRPFHSRAAKAAREEVDIHV